jgi:serine protease Do
MKKLSILLVLLLVAGMAYADSDKAQRGYLGISVANVENIDENEDDGVYVSSVYPGSGAEAAGLKEGDRFVSINGVRVVEMDDMDPVLDISHPGDSVDVVVRRDGREEGFTVVLGKRSGSQNLLFRDDKSLFGNQKLKYVLELAKRGPRMGIQSQGLSEQLAAFFEVDGGVLITSVIDDSPASRAGLRAGDIVLEMNGRTIRSEAEIASVMAGIEGGQTVDVTVQSKGRLEVLAVTLDDAVEQANTAAFNVLLGGSDSATKTIELDVPAATNLEFGPTDQSEKAIREKMNKLQAELKRLEEKLERIGNE